jgi:hypothetical protein
MGLLHRLGRVRIAAPVPPYHMYQVRTYPCGGHMGGGYHYYSPRSPESLQDMVHVVRWNGVPNSVWWPRVLMTCPRFFGVGI